MKKTVMMAFAAMLAAAVMAAERMASLRSCDLPPHKHEKMV